MKDQQKGAWIRLIVACLAVLWCQPVVLAAPNQAELELQKLSQKVKRFKVIDLPKTGELSLTNDQSLTSHDLRGISLDDNPPVLGKPTKPYDARMTDDCPPGQEPYIATDVQPFRFRYFNNEFNYGGWHTWAMSDYASAHGFSILSAYVRKPTDATHLPAGTQWLTWGGAIDWEKWPEENGLGKGRYDKLTEINLVQKLVDGGAFKHDPNFQYLMIDMEHGWHSPDSLRKQDWYPKDARDAGMQAFEKKYYDGYALTYSGPVQAAHQVGWKNVSVYGWEPYGRSWYGVEKAQVDPLTDWAWNAFGKQIYEAVDILNPSVYCFYWSPQNVAYTLANIDLNMKFVNSMTKRKPVRPYYWTLLHGGGGGWRWWANQPLPNEEVRAMIALGFFAGIDGFDCWNWSGTGSHVATPPIKTEADAMLKDGLELKPEGAAPDAALHAFKRYDVLHILSVDDKGLVRFQPIENQGKNHGIAADKPSYTMPKDQLLPHLRPSAEPVAAMIEGLALVKPFEYLLRNGEVKVDVSSQEQFAKTLPIVRRVKLGKIHVVATYDPLCIYGKEPREVVLQDFDGRKGLMVKLPADEETRMWVVRG